MENILTQLQNLLPPPYVSHLLVNLRRYVIDGGWQQRQELYTVPIQPSLVSRGLQSS